MAPGVATEPRDDASCERDDRYELTAEIRFQHDRLLLSPTLTARRGLTFRFDGHTTAGPGPDYRYVSASGPDLDDVYGTLRGDATVAEARTVATFDDGTVYRVTPAPDAKCILPLLADVGGFVRDMQGDCDGWTVRMHLPTRTALAALNDLCDGRGVDLSVVRLADLRREREPDPSPLTAAQRELLAVASEHGYFETPRRISQRELADQFDVSPSAISQRLRTAVGNLVSNAFTPA